MQRLSGLERLEPGAIRKCLSSSSEGRIEKVSLKESLSIEGPHIQNKEIIFSYLVYLLWSAGV
jgi:hypothetical protein